MNKETLGQNIKKHRAFLGLDQNQLAELVGLSTGVISKIERGIENVTLDNLTKIASALKVGLEELFCDEKTTLKIVISKENAETIRAALSELSKVLRPPEGSGIL